MGLRVFTLSLPRRTRSAPSPRAAPPDYRGSIPYLGAGCLDQLGVSAGVPLCQHFLEHLQPTFELLVGHRLEPGGMLDLQLARYQMRADLQVYRWVLLPHLFNRGRSVLFEVGSEREQEILVERSTCSLQ